MPIKFNIPDWFAKKKDLSRSREELSQSPQANEKRKGKLDLPGDLWVKCFKCNETLYISDLKENLKVCPKCDYHFKLTFKERLIITIDNGTFKEYDPEIKSIDFLHFIDSQPYAKRLEKSAKKSGLNEAIVTGEGTINGIRTAFGIMDFSFMGGSMGSVVGEKITRMVEQATTKKLPVIIISSSGGARMQEGIMSLMQMAKTSGALALLAKKNLPYISICTDPTTGGTTASYAMLGDFNVAEPGALIGFAGPRVIEQTIRQKLPPGFQRAEYLLGHGMVDMVVHRKEMKGILTKILKFCLKTQKPEPSRSGSGLRKKHG